MVSRSKHPAKVHVWGGISSRVAIAIVIFTGILTATRYTDILEASLVPFIEEHYLILHPFLTRQRPKEYKQVVTIFFSTEENQLVADSSSQPGS